MPKNKPADASESTPVSDPKSSETPKKKVKEETSKVIALSLTPYLNSLIRSFMFFNGPMTNRSFLDSSITHFIEFVSKVEQNKKASAFSVLPRYDESERFSSYATKKTLDDLEEIASDNGIPYQIAYYSAISYYMRSMIDSKDPKMNKPLAEAQEKFPDIDKQII